MAEAFAQKDVLYTNVCVCVCTNMPIRTVAEAFAQKDVREVLRQMEMLLCDMGVEGSKSLRSLFLCVFLVFFFSAGVCAAFFFPRQVAAVAVSVRVAW